MKKILLATAVLIVALALAGDRSTANPMAPAPAPGIVAKAKLVDQTAPIPVTTMFTAPEDGLYRLSFYPSITTADPSSHSTWNFNIFWTDLGAPLSFAPLSFGNGNRAGMFETTPNPICLQLKAGTALTYSVTGGGDSSVYSLYFTLERLE
jgi:hypothetical protein